MSDIGPYGVTQNPDEAMVTANELVGEHAGNVTAHQADSERFSPARSSTAPYADPNKSIWRECARETCHGIAKNDSDYCRWHQP